MKVSYYDLFDMIAEDAGKLLSQAEQSPIHPENYSSDTTITAVKEKIKETESQKNAHIKKLSVCIFSSQQLLYFLCQELHAPHISMICSKTAPH